MAANKFYDVIPGGPAPGMQPGCIGPYIIFDPDGRCLYAWDSRLHVWEQLCIPELKGPCELEACDAAVDMQTLQFILCDGDAGCKQDVSTIIAFVLDHLSIAPESGIATDVSVVSATDPVTGITTYTIKVDVRYSDGIGLNGVNQLVVVPEANTGITVTPAGVGFDGCAVVEDDAAPISTAIAAATEFLATTRDSSGVCRFARLDFLAILNKLIKPGTNITFTAGPDGEIVVNGQSGGTPVNVCDAPVSTIPVEWDTTGDCSSAEEVIVCSGGTAEKRKLAWPGHSVVGAAVYEADPVFIRFDGGLNTADDVITGPWVEAVISNPSQCRQLLVNAVYLLRCEQKGLYGNGKTYPGIADLELSVDGAPATDLITGASIAWGNTLDTEAGTNSSTNSDYQTPSAFSVPAGGTISIRVRAKVYSTGAWHTTGQATAFQAFTAIASIHIQSGMTY